MTAACDRLIEPPRQSFFLLGMRGAGKSTWARAAFPDAVYVDLLDERLYQDLLGDPSLFAQSIGDTAPNGWVVVDEVQRVTHPRNADNSCATKQDSSICC